MMRLSKLADYAVVILSALALRPESQHAATKLADYTRLPVPTVAKVLKRMAKANIVYASRGAAGGYRLTKPATEVTIAEIVEAIDGPIAIMSCVGEKVKEEPCGREDVCPIYGRWEPLNEAINRVFSTITLQQLVLSEQKAMETMLMGAPCEETACNPAMCRGA